MSSDDAGQLGPMNLRDVGGLPTVNGGRTRRGVLFRGDAPYPGDTDLGALRDPSDVIDLRSLVESSGGAQDSYRWPDRTVVHSVPLLTEAAPELQSRPLADLYRTMLDTASTQIADVVRIIAHAHGQVLVHCAVGKDRTGVAIAVVLLAVDTEPAAVISDYLDTEARIEAVFGRIGSKHQGDFDYTMLPPHILKTDRSAIEAVLEVLSREPGGAQGWLRARGVSEADLALLRAKLSTSPTAE